MAAIVTGCLGAVGGMVGELILRQFKYLYCFRANITNLKNEAEKLNSAQGVVISGEVETWLQKSNEIKREIDGILNEVPNVGSGCFSLGARFSLSKRAEETTDRLKELLDEYRFDTNPISLQRPPAAMPIPSEMSYDFDSRKNIEDGIMATLREGDVNMMGICGMGGLGKTTMARRIMNRALVELVFEEIVLAVVSQHVEESKIQLEIARSLGLNLEQEGLQGRAQKLHTRLISGPKRTLIILDDVWETLKLKDLGIPSDDKGCTILFTSRNRDVLSVMNVKIFGMEELSVEDSWFLFKKVAGTYVNDTELNSEAKEVVNECKGLPIALTTVGAVLKDEVRVCIWKDALVQLRQCDPDIPELISSVYNPLKLSYDNLGSKQKSVFLLCCLFPEDADIPLEHLTYFCMGLRIFGRGIRGLEEARNRMLALIKMLKSRSLLLDSKFGDVYVRMHDVVRDVCIFIAKQEGYIGDNDLTSSLQRYKLHSGFELLQIRNSDEEINFHGITDLYVLSIERCSLTSLPFTQRPNNLITLVLDSCRGLETLSVVGELVNLEILICRRCDSVKELPPEIWDDRISSNSFQNLKILKLDDLPVLKQLWKSSQNNLGKDFLPQLEVLEIKYCEMMEAVFLWKGEDGNENNSCHPITKRFPKLKELWLNLPNLISLCQGIEGIEFPLLKRITIEYCGKMKGMVWNENKASIQGLFCSREVSFSELGKLAIRGCQGILSLFTSSMAENLVNLKELWIGDCDEMVEVIKDDEEKGMNGGRRRPFLFPKLQELVLLHLPKLVSFCESKGIESIQFPVLRSMEIRECGKMKGMLTSNENNSGGDSTNAADIIHLFCQSKQVSFGCLKSLDSDRNPFCSHTIHVSIFDRLEELDIIWYKGSMSLFSSSITGNLVNLTTLTIEVCYKMVKVIEEKEEEKEKVVSGAQRTTILFPKLHKIELLHLHKLVRFCEWKCDVELPSLTELKIKDCRNMKSFTLGLLTTPNLKSVEIEDEEFGDVKDLNGLVQQQYLSRAEETTDVATQKEAPAAAAK